MTETNGKILDWQEGDLLLLPVQPDGSVHQHWNKDASKGCRWVAFRDLLMARYIANAIDQVSDTPELRGASGSGPLGERQGEWKASATTEQMPMVAHPDDLKNLNLFDQLMGLRDLQRRRLKQATFLIRGSELPWEQNAHGKMQWYLHPALAYTAVQTHLFYRQEIAPGSRSGVQRHGGDAFPLFDELYFNRLRGEQVYWYSFAGYFARSRCGILMASLPSTQPHLINPSESKFEKMPTAQGSRRAYFTTTDSFIECPIYRRTELGHGCQIHGPAIIEQMDTTTIIPPDFQMYVDPWENLILQQIEKADE